MAQDLVRDDITVQDGVLVGPLRRSVNNAINSKGSIHDDETASRLGFRGGTVAGSIHMDLFPPLLLKAFGPRWFERGTLSLYFLNATVDREPVRAFLRQPPAGARDVQVEVWIERDDGMKVGAGTASVGDTNEPTALMQRDLGRFEPGELRILKNIKAGDPIPPVPVRYTLEDHERRMKVITEPLDWYTGPSPWGGPILSPAAMVNALYSKPVAQLRQKMAPGVGLFGAIELRNFNGPIFVDRDYSVGGTVAAVGQSPQTEYMWYDTEMKDEDGKLIAGMRMMLRWMKQSSPVYQQQ